ncbi:N-acyl-D-amino-acid deacylase family protein [Thalassotalea hakodatensis]|uniref:N-acyl-D-amino-acid deacylase family protein n=1 Tax=Thalassotalea hakodatensis TaxID=3030492 RepID=UPI002572C289|nr:amidohydrolase family protein [Thalassotalea hakodatensis]
MKINLLKKYPIALLSIFILSGCKTSKPEKVNADYLITNGKVFIGNNVDAQDLDVAICQSTICAVSKPGEMQIKAIRTIDANGLIVSPGFIDPHTHTLDELLSVDKNANVNYLTQGVTTVINGNDGGGPTDINALAKKLTNNGIGTNVALYVGHNSVRNQVMGRENRFATTDEIAQMKTIVDLAMQDGALGLSSGLYYVPGSYASTEEVVALTTIVGKYHGVYDTHLRDESTFNIGFLNALSEAINIAKQANTHLHVAHIKALGVDVWGQSTQAINKIEAAQKAGVSISADQYPWLASGTKLHSAIMPKWVMADSKDAFYQRLNDPKLTSKLTAEIAENIRKRGGAKSLLITAFSDHSLVGKTLEQLARELNLPPELAAMELVQRGDIRIASFNMSANDLESFIIKPWVVTSSDGTNGHPRKYASFPKKYQTYVKQQKKLSLKTFIAQSSSKTANYLNITDRGLIKEGLAADIIIWDENGYAPKANFSEWNKHSVGMRTVFVNGQIVLEQGKYNHKLAGEFVKKALENNN